MKALVIDDSPIIRRILSLLLKRHNFHPITASDGVQGLNLLANNNEIRLAMVDWNMPKLNGLEFVTQVRSNPQYKDVKLMMVTARDTVKDIETARSLGVDDFIMKPISKEILAQKLRTHGLN
tara:strand:- start:591 stop:956 length:366 start_codon:yes stop_codon:yes gene_type:complete